nr:RNA-directed DNA polymerase [Tanacetum cinerariifolium]
MFHIWKKGHFAKDCRSKQRNIARSAVYQELDLDDNWDIVSADFDDSSIYSISKGEGDTHQNISVMVQDAPIEEIAFMAIKEDDEKMVQAVGSWKPNKELAVKSKECEHDWKENTVTNYTICYYCGILTTDMSRLNCLKCQLTTCALCARNYLDALKIIDQLRDKKERLEEQKDEEIKKFKAQLQKRKEEVEVEFDIPDCSAFGTTAIIDTGASTCCINKKVVPKEALEPLTDDVFFNGLNSRQQTTHKIKQGNFLIEGNKFRIPLIYAFDMNDSNGIEMLIGANFLSNGIEMLIGANFLRSMKGGIQIEGDEITIYKKVNKIKTSNQTEIAEIP